MNRWHQQFLRFPVKGSNDINGQSPNLPIYPPKKYIAKCWLEKTRPFGLIELEDQFYSSGSAQNKNKDKNIFLHPGKKSFSKGQKVLKL